MKRVILDGRVFMIRHDHRGAYSIRERKTKGTHVYDASYWHFRRSPGGENSIPSRVLRAGGFL